MQISAPAPVLSDFRLIFAKDGLAQHAENYRAVRQSHLAKARSAYRSSGEARDKKVAEGEYYRKEQQEHGGE